MPTGGREVARPWVDHLTAGEAILLSAASSGTVLPVTKSVAIRNPLALGCQPVVSGRADREADDTSSEDLDDDRSSATTACSIAATLAVIGDRWTLLILRDVFRGVRRFGLLRDDLGIAKNLLADRLTKLVDHGVLEKVAYHDRPLRHEYRLTPKGADLSTALIALMGWGDRWYASDGPPTVLVHHECGTPLEQSVRCPRCDAPVTPGGIRSRPGPGRSAT
jgi:DNA-binding HxlR family transcriptional regulator